MAAARTSTIACSAATGSLGAIHVAPHASAASSSRASASVL
jgi:hypothetical protein